MFEDPAFWINLVNQVLVQFQQDSIRVAIFSIAIAAYGIIVWHYYRFLATRDIITEAHIEGKGFGSSILKLFFGAFNILKYVILFPIITFLMFSVLSLFLFLLAKEQPIENILLVAITLISATRITAYYNEDLSKDLAKLIPFALLGVAIVQPNFFSIDLVIQRLESIPNFLVHISSFVLFTVILEIALKILITIKHIVFGDSKDKKEETKKLGEPLKIKIGENHHRRLERHNFEN